MIRSYDSAQRAEDVMKEALWLAWVAAGGPRGMGFLQDFPEADKEAVWNNAVNAGDYPMKQNLGDDLHADYVFGRMIKLNIWRKRPDAIEISDSPPRSDYQSWCHAYKTYADLFDAAEKNVGVAAEQVEVRA